MGGILQKNSGEQHQENSLHETPPAPCAFIFGQPRDPFARPYESRISRCSPTSSKTPIELVFPELLEKPALVEFLKQRKIYETLRRQVPCPRLRFSRAVYHKLYPLKC